MNMKEYYFVGGVSHGHIIQVADGINEVRMSGIYEAGLRVSAIIPPECIYRKRGFYDALHPQKKPMEIFCLSDLPDWRILELIDELRIL